MRALFDLLKAVILAGVPALKTIRMYNNQISQSNIDRKEKAFPHPACFIEFITGEVINRAMGIKDTVLIIRFRFALESYKFERLDDLDFLDTFDAIVQALHGDQNDAVTFTTIGQATIELDEDFDNVAEPHLDYQTVWRNTAAYKRTNDITVAAPAVSISTAFIGQGFDVGFDKGFN